MPHRQPVHIGFLGIAGVLLLFLCMVIFVFPQAASPDVPPAPKPAKSVSDSEELNSSSSAAVAMPTEISLKSNIDGTEVSNDTQEVWAFALKQTTIRAEPTHESEATCVVYKNESVLIESVDGDWAKIALYKFPVNCFGWIIAEDLYKYEVVLKD